MTKATLDDRVTPHPQVVDTQLDEGEVVLLHLESKIYYSLNLTGQRIWDGVKEGLVLREISRRLREEFDVDAERADSSVVELIGDLSQQGLVQIIDR
jgi:hypothetical protein